LQMADGRITPLFIDITTPEFAPADPHKADPDDILKSISAEGPKLGDFLKLITIAYEVDAPTLMGISVFAGYTLVMVYPEKKTTGETLFKKSWKFSPRALTDLTEAVSRYGSPMRNPVTFSPGALNNLKEVISRYGEPTSKQIWSDDLTRLVALDGFVYWWGQIGVSASKDGKITHVLVRHSIKKK